MGCIAGAAAGTDLFMMAGSTAMPDSRTGNDQIFNGTIADDSIASIANGTLKFGEAITFPNEQNIIRVLSAPGSQLWDWRGDCFSVEGRAGRRLRLHHYGRGRRILALGQRNVGGGQVGIVSNEAWTQ